MKKILFILVLTLYPIISFGARVVADSTYVVDAVSVTTLKQGSNIRQEPLSATLLGSVAIEQSQIKAIKGLQTIVPNLYIPEYGSRITSSIYVRGIGARIDQPVIGLNVDNTPYLNKNAFDTDIVDIARMEILRGPQSTLYGRNTIGGVVNIYTLSPMDFEGVKIGAEYSSGNTYRLRGSIYEKFSDRFAASLSGYYGSSDGLFENDFTKSNCDTEEEGGARLRAIYKISDRTTISNATSLSILNQGGYPYRAIDSDVISYNDICSYDRTLLNSGITIEHIGKKIILSSATSYQHLNDVMQLDQDFSPQSIFTLKQAINERTLSEDILIRNHERLGYNYLVGAFRFYKDQAMAAPVTFKEQGIADLIVANIPTQDTYIWNSDSFVLDSDIATRTTGSAIYHQSSYKWRRWEVAAGIRLDYEMVMLNYHSYTDTGAKRYNAEGELVWDKVLDIDLEGEPTLDFFELLPKATAKFKINDNNSLYGSITKGYKAGGFNTQMFSDILQQALMERFGLSALYSPEEIIAYDPEYSWNYEIGGHFANRSNTLRADLAIFYIDCRDQQLTIFPDDMVTGRLMTNAGVSRSYGVEASVMARQGNFDFNASYGYTNAKFVDYNDGEQDYSGNFIPYAPQQTIYASASYTFDSILKRGNIVVECNTNGAGRIYWNEDNSLSQPLYALIGGSVTLQRERYTLSVWGRNLTNTIYNTFYFESMGNEFVEQAKPMTIGVTLNLTLNKHIK